MAHPVPLQQLCSDKLIGLFSASKYAGQETVAQLVRQVQAGLFL